MINKERHAVVKAFGKKYRNSNKKDRSLMLSQLVITTGYTRKHLMDVLSHPPVFKKQIHRSRSSKYQLVLPILKQLWVIANYACGQRLVPMLPTYLESLIRHKEMTIAKNQKQLLLQISSATVDRLLKHDRRSISLKGRSRTKPGTLLKHQIPIKTWADWDNTIPGFLEIDSVHHCGSSLYGEYLYTLDTTDVATGWNECCAHLGRSERHTILALEQIQKRLPFPLLGIDFDCGGEFVNYHLIRFCQKKQISYTRARETIKNDQPYIEQQNYSVVRRFTGYQRLDTEKQLENINQLYLLLSDYQNFFQSIMKLKNKIRDGAKVTRKYSKAKTAYQRIVDRSDIPLTIKQQLRKRFLHLNPKKLIKEITELGIKLDEKQ